MTGRGRAVVVMAKEPRPGRTKTRLVPALTAEAAAGLYECFLRDALDHARSVVDATQLVAVWPPGSDGYFERLAPDFGQVTQQGSSLSERLESVLTRCSQDGFGQVVAINSDSPTLPQGRVAAAFAALDDDAVDVCLGPAHDGGYYLIGWKRTHPRLVRDVTMSTPRVLDDTLRLAAELGLGVRLLEPWYDVDRPADLDRMERELHTTTDTARHTRRFLAAARSGPA